MYDALSPWKACIARHASSSQYINIVKFLDLQTPKYKIFLPAKVIEYNQKLNLKFSTL